MKVGDRIMFKNVKRSVMFSSDFIGVVTKTLKGDSGANLLKFKPQQGSYKTIMGKYWMSKNEPSWYMPASWFEPYYFKTTKKRTLKF